MTRHELTNNVKQAALGIGFTKAGVTSAKPFDEAADRLEAWVASGAHGLMSYMERGHDKRRDVKNILPMRKNHCLSTAVRWGVSVLRFRTPLQDPDD